MSITTDLIRRQATSDYPFARSMGFTGPKKQILSQIHSRLRTRLINLIPCPTNRILPTRYLDHYLTGPLINLRASNMAGLAQCVTRPSTPTAGDDIMPSQQAARLSLTQMRMFETLSVPGMNSPEHAAHNVAGRLPMAPLPGAQPPLAPPSPLPLQIDITRRFRPARALLQSQGADDGRPRLSVQYRDFCPFQVYLSSTSIMRLMIFRCHLHPMERFSFLPPPGMVRFISSAFFRLYSPPNTTPSGDDVISISSDSSDASLELLYPDTQEKENLPAPTVLDVLTPVRLVIFVNDKESPSRITVYPRHAEGVEPPALHINDYRDALLAIGFNTAAEGDIYMDFLGFWSCRSWDISIPVLFPNRLVYIRSLNVTADVDSFLDSMF
ncbi:hypothetical protein C8R45DRAFT_1155986 [Mycena sanguinolenta]|nr:hypothetical protein C8R45DRAFT_1155986 [Mycena sanguinolenta]